MTFRSTLAAALAAGFGIPAAGVAAPPAQAAMIQAQTPATQAVLEATLADLRTGAPDTSNFTPELASAIAEQQPSVDQFFAQAGAVTDVTYQASQNGGDLYRVEFENVSTIWAIAMEGETITGLGFQQAPPAGAAGQSGP